jgi:putative FmdB family regulatory protein
MTPAGGHHAVTFRVAEEKAVQIDRRGSFMPTYEYRCPEGHEFELFQRMSDEPGAACPTCGRLAERRLSAGGGFLFKGSGFYITDYRSDSYRSAAKAESGGGEKSGGSDTSGGEAAKSSPEAPAAKPAAPAAPTPSSSSSDS